MSADGARRACAKGRATRNDAVTRDVLYVLQLIEVTQFLAENATCPPPPFYSVRVANYCQVPKWRF